MVTVNVNRTVCCNYEKGSFISTQGIDCSWHLYHTDIVTIVTNCWQVCLMDSYVWVWYNQLNFFSSFFPTYFRPNLGGILSTVSRQLYSCLQHKYPTWRGMYVCGPGGDHSDHIHLCFLFCGCVQRWCTVHLTAGSTGETLHASKCTRPITGTYSTGTAALSSVLVSSLHFVPEYIFSSCTHFILSSPLPSPPLPSSPLLSSPLSSPSPPLH